MKQRGSLVLSLIPLNVDGYLFSSSGHARGLVLRAGARGAQQVVGDPAQDAIARVERDCTAASEPERRKGRQARAHNMGSSLSRPNHFAI